MPLNAIEAASFIDVATSIPTGPLKNWESLLMLAYRDFHGIKASGYLQL